MQEILEISVEDLHLHKDKYILVDVREPHELVGSEGQIEKSILAPLGSSLIQFLESADPAHEYVFICRSGCRSGKACLYASTYGLKKVYNLKGGMLAWNKSKSAVKAIS
jgi:rhodanese-related sulfurtransferase